MCPHRPQRPLPSAGRTLTGKGRITDGLRLHKTGQMRGEQGMSCSLTEGAAPVGTTCVCGGGGVHYYVLCVPLYHTFLENIQAHFMRDDNSNICTI